MSLDNTIGDVARRAGYVLAIVSLVIALGTIWTMFDLPVFATRGYVDTKNATIISTVIELARDQRERLKRTRDATVARLTVATDPQIRSDLQALVEQSNQDVADVEFQITALERMRKNP